MSCACMTPLSFNIAKLFAVVAGQMDTDARQPTADWPANKGIDLSPPVRPNRAATADTCFKLHVQMRRRIDSDNDY